VCVVLVHLLLELLEDIVKRSVHSCVHFRDSLQSTGHCLGQAGMDELLYYFQNVGSFSHSLMSMMFPAGITIA
jgi:hypothetical protein